MKSAVTSSPRVQGNNRYSPGPLSVRSDAPPFSGALLYTTTQLSLLLSSTLTLSSACGVL